MKKTVIIILSVFVLLIAVLIAIPVFFKPALIDATKSSLNSRFNAQVEFEDFKLSIFRNFPKLTIELQNVVVKGKGEFETDTLLFVENAGAKMSLFSIFAKTGRSIEEIKLERPKLNLITGKTGSENWNIEAENTIEQHNQPAVQTVKTEEPFSLQLEKIGIKNGTLIYQDREINMYQVFNGVNLNLKGKMYGSSTELAVDGNVESYSVDYKGVRYISNVTLQTTSKLKVDYDKMNISITENELLMNRLPMQVTGLIQIPSDSVFFDLAIKTKTSDFENFLALVPPGYEEYLKKIKTGGTASVAGTVKGLYFEEIYPAVDLKIDVANGNLKYIDLPEEIKSISAGISLSKPQGELDLTELWIKNAHVEIKNNPVDLTLMLKNPFTDLWFDGAFVGKINFDQLKNALPLDSVNISGTLDANIFVKGNYSSIEKEEYEKLNVSGIVLLDNFLFDSRQLNQKVVVTAGKLDFSPQNVNLSQFNMKLGQSDFNLTGKVSNYLNYILKDGILKGDLQLVSSFVNINELLRIRNKNFKVTENGKPASNQTTEVSITSNEPAASEKLAFDIPKNVDITFHSKIEKAVFDKLPMSEITGLITAKNGKLLLNGLNLKTLDGELKLSGSYENTQQNQPLVDFNMDVNGFDIPVAFQSLSGFQKMAPIAAQSEGKLSTALKIKGQLTPSFKIIPATIDGTGMFGTKNLRIINSPVFKELKGILKPEKLQNVTIDDFTANFNIENGNIDLKPFKTKVAGQETTMFGTLSAENLLNMRLDFKITRDAFGTDVQNVLSAIPGNKTITMLPAGVNISGPVGKPAVKVDLSEATKIVTNAAKEGLKDSVNQLGKELKKLFGK